MVRAALVIARFFRHEIVRPVHAVPRGHRAGCTSSCGASSAGTGSVADLDTIDEVGGYMEGHTICALSDAAAWGPAGFLRRFRPEFEAHVSERRLPARRRASSA